MAKELYNIKDIDDYQNRLTPEQKENLIKHCNKYNVAPEICAWYDDMDDYYSDWCSDNIGYSKAEARDKIKTNDNGEFKKFSNGEIVRLIV